MPHTHNSAFVSKSRIVETLRVLRAAHPVFRAPAPRPLQIGILAALRTHHPTLSRRQLQATLRYITRAPLYLRALTTPHARRHDLDNNPTEPVSQEHRAKARVLLGQLRARDARRFLRVPPPPPTSLPLRRTVPPGTRPTLTLGSGNSRKRASGVAS